MPIPAATTLALPFLEQAGRGALQLAQTPVLGWERVQSYTKGRKRPVVIVERSSVTVRAWELALVGGIAYLLVAGTVLRQAQEQGTAPLLPGNIQTIFDFFF